MTKPNFDGRISLGNVITIVSMIVGATFFWAEASGRISAVEKGQEAQSSAIIEQRTRLRAVETMAQRQDATNVLILQSLTEIKGRLERIEAQGGRE